MNLALFWNGWDIIECLEFFRYFAKHIFPPKHGFSTSIFARIIRMIKSYFDDGRYDATSLEDTLIEAFGCQPMFDVAKKRPSGMKIAVTATTIANADLCLFTNYNGANKLSKDSGRIQLLIIWSLLTDLEAINTCEQSKQKMKY